jgi:hypothetical protein
MATAKKTKTVRLPATAAADAERATYQVRQPFKFRGARLPPTLRDGTPVFIELTADEAEELLAAGLIGTPEQR